MAYVRRSPHPPPAEEVKRLLLCSGKLYYELNAKRTELGSQGDIAIVRVEQVHPCPAHLPCIAPNHYICNIERLREKKHKQPGFL